MVGTLEPGPAPDDRATILRYWHFYEPQNAAILHEVEQALAERPHLVPLLDALAADAPVHDGHRLWWVKERAAICEGRWAELFDYLHALGARCASERISSATWFELVDVFRGAIERQIAAAARPDSADLYRGMSRFLSLFTEHIVEGYVARTGELVVTTEARYRKLFEHSPQPMWTYDPETLRFRDVNAAAIRQYGFTREEFLGMTLADIRPSEDVPLLRDLVGHDHDRVVTVRHRVKDGRIITVEIKATNFVDDEQPVRLVVAQDITEAQEAQEALRKVEDQLRHAQKMEAIGRLAGGVAHDFNNVLTVIESYAFMLEESLEEDDARRADAIEIRRASERATAITRRLLAMSRHGVATPRAVDLDQLVSGFATTMHRLIGDRINLAVKRATVSPVAIDPDHFEQVLMNLVVNARDAMPQGGRLTIELAELALDTESGLLHGLPPGPYIQVAVTDTGSGMDAETQRHIFEPFFTTKDVNGTGLGLSIVHGIVTQARGGIAVYSEPGHGTTFRIYLPVTDDTTAAPQVVAVTAPRTLPPLQVLVVDDQPEIRAVAARILQRAGCRTIEAASGEAARRIVVAHESRIDVALVDLMLGDARGDQLARQLRELLPELRVVLMSGYAGGAIDASGATPSSFLSKPFTPAQLRGAIAGVLEATATATDDAPAVAQPQRIRVLLAEDDPQLRRLLSKVLERNNFELIAVENGKRAIAELERNVFDVVLSDVQMPEGGGLDLLRAVRRIDLDVPVILMSGMPDVATAQAAVEYGAFRYLTKPVDNHVVIRLVQHAARAHALARLRREAFSLTGAPVGAVDRAGLEVRFDQALDSMWMALQPIVNARSGVLFGVEALLRSNEPTMTNPQSVVEAAAQLGRLPRLGRRVRQLCAEIHAGRAHSIFVNLHPEDLLDAELCADGSPLSAIADKVILEVTERAALATSPDLTRRVMRLREMGYRIAVDDIGAGYSGLTSFTELMPEVVKIDMSLVRDVHLSKVKQRTIAALTTLCHEVYTLVVAEGVESSEERDCLVELGCDLLQGFLLGRPSRDQPA